MIDLQKIADFLSAQRGISRIIVEVVDSSAMKNPRADGECVWQQGFIRINESIIYHDIGFMMAVCHEWRHWWQYNRYQEHFLWWMNSRNKEWYRTVYYTQLCTIEEDARIFGCSLGLRASETLLQKDTHHLTEVKDRYWSAQGASRDLLRTLPQFEQASRNKMDHISAECTPRYHMYLNLCS